MKVIPLRLAALAAPALILVFAVSASSAADVIAIVKYTCADDKMIHATYYAEKVDLILSDGRTLSVPQAMSGSGARYANADESFVFWNKGDDAFITEGDANNPTYTDCVGVKA